MSEALELPPQLAWQQPALAAALLAVDPAGLGGILLRARPGPVRDAWLQQLQALLPADTPWRRMPLHIGDDRLLGGLDLTATLQSGRPVSQRGLLAECHGGVLLIAMAERLEIAVAAKLAAVLDHGAVAVERGGLSQRIPASLGMIALDEGIDEDEGTPVVLADRLAIHLDLETIPLQEIGTPLSDRSAIAKARLRLAGITISAALVEALCRAALGLGIESLRVPLLAVRVARASAALNDNDSVDEADAALAAQMVFACRATRLPVTEQEAEQQEEPRNESEPESNNESAATNDADPPTEDEIDLSALQEQVQEAVRASMPPQLLEQLRFADPSRQAARTSGKSAARRRPARRGRPVGTRPGELTDQTRLNLVETLRVAAPWQTLRKAKDAAANSDAATPSVRVRPEDFRISRFKQQAATTTVFAVDASGSAALHRLAEAKGAVELMLAESYQRRDQVALVTFRGQDAELLLPPTRSLVRAKRSLAALPGGGGTPLAAGIRTALDTALAIRRKAETPVIILLTDGRANVTLQGQGDRQLAEKEAREAAQQVRAEGITTLLVDTSPRPRPTSRQLADTMGAHYLALPHADARRLSGAAQNVLASSSDRESRA